MRILVDTRPNYNTLTPSDSEKRFRQWERDARVRRHCRRRRNRKIISFRMFLAHRRTHDIHMFHEYNCAFAQWRRASVGPHSIPSSSIQFGVFGFPFEFISFAVLHSTECDAIVIEAIVIGIVCSSAILQFLD